MQRSVRLITLNSSPRFVRINKRAFPQQKTLTKKNFSNCIHTSRSSFHTRDVPHELCTTTSHTRSPSCDAIPTSHLALHSINLVAFLFFFFSCIVRRAPPTRLRSLRRGSSPTGRCSSFRFISSADWGRGGASRLPTSYRRAFVTSGRKASRQVRKIAFRRRS